MFGKESRPLKELMNKEKCIRSLEVEVAKLSRAFFVMRQVGVWVVPELPDWWIIFNQDKQNSWSESSSAPIKTGLSQAEAAPEEERNNRKFVQSPLAR